MLYIVYDEAAYGLLRWEESQVIKTFNVQRVQTTQVL